MSASARQAKAMRIAPTESGAGAAQGVGMNFGDRQPLPASAGRSWKVSSTTRENRLRQSY